MKTNIKMRVNYEQSKRVQEICFENRIYWVNGDKKVDTYFYPFIFIDSCISRCSESQEYYFINSDYEEIDADLFIRTNGTCKEKDLLAIGAIDYYLENIQLKKKIENLHIALNKKAENNITNLKDYIECKKIIKKYNFIDERNEFISKVLQSKYDVIDYFKDILKESSCKIENQWNEIARLRASSQNNIVNLNKEIDRLNFIIKYLEGRLNEK